MRLPAGEGWNEALQAELEADYFARLQGFVAAERERGCCYPPPQAVFEAFRATPLERVKVVLLGQDPYHEPGQAMGLSFSVPTGVPLPPSLRNIIKEIEDDLGVTMPAGHGDLSPWAEQGVLLLNTTLTVRQHEAGSHAGHGWENFTDAVIAALNERRKGLVFMLWGAYAGKKRALIDEGRHHLLLAPHPSPLSAYRGFFGCKHFSQANALLRQQGMEPIDWTRIN